MMNWYGQDGAGWWMLLMPVMWIVLIGIATWIVLLLTRSHAPVSQTPPTPEEVLQRRLAAGDVTIEEYTRTRAALHDGHAPSMPKTPTVKGATRSLSGSYRSSHSLVARTSRGLSWISLEPSSIYSLFCVEIHDRCSVAANLSMLSGVRSGSVTSTSSMYTSVTCAANSTTTPANRNGSELCAVSATEWSCSPIGRIR